MIELTLPWPPKDLSPNARIHWTKRAKAAKAYRAECARQCAAHKWGYEWKTLQTTGRLHLWIDFYPPDRRHRDDDNMVAAFKSGRDGLADALGINDRRFICHPFVKDQIGGMVKVRITGGPEA
jgi:crossover junction endodeoxyribonuclease RusA